MNKILLIILLSLISCSIDDNQSSIDPDAACNQLTVSTADKSAYPIIFCTSTRYRLIQNQYGIKAALNK